MNITWLQQPYWVGSYAGNYLLEWDRQHAGKNYLTCEGQPVTAIGGRGTWVDDASAPIINGSPAQRFVPDMTDPLNAVYAAGTMYGRGGQNTWVLNVQGHTAILQVKGNPIPADTPPPVTTVQTPTMSPDQKVIIKTLLTQIEECLYKIRTAVGG